jgi:TPR repeat protein
MTRRWTTFFAAAVLVASLACRAVPGPEDDPVSSNSTGDFDVEEEPVFQPIVVLTSQTLEELLEQAEQGDADAQVSLASRYYEQDVKDHVEAERWYRLAANQGEAVAQYSLGYMYAKGHGVPQDYVARSGWFRLAAEQGLDLAQYELARAYVRGEGVPQNNVQAHKWANLAAARTTPNSPASGSMHVRASDLRDWVAERLTPDQLAEAQRLAREWDAAHPRD